MLKITVSDNEQTCTVEGNFKDICAETVLALRALIEAIEEVDDKTAKLFSLKLPDICAFAILDDEERESLANFIKEGGQS